MKKIISIILIISISMTLLFTALENNAYSKNYYLKAFEANNVLEVTGKSMEELAVISDALIEYLKGNGYDELLIPYFNDKEVAHMRDVQDLFDRARMLKYTFGALSLILLIYIAIKYDKKSLGKLLFIGLFSNHILIISLALIIATNFNKYWTIFHHIFFTNDLWLLNPETDLMIQMLPEQFFSGMVIRIVLSFFAYLSIIQLAGLYYMKKGRGKWKDTRDLGKDI